MLHKPFLVFLHLFLSVTAYCQNTDPIILIHGFLGWGREEMAGYYYWGGRMDLEAELNRSKSAPDPDDLLSRFIEAAAPYAERKGISYAAFREVGVPASVLRKAGLKS